MMSEDKNCTFEAVKMNTFSKRSILNEPVAIAGETAQTWPTGKKVAKDDLHH